MLLRTRVERVKCAVRSKEKKIGQLRRRGKLALPENWQPFIRTMLYKISLRIRAVTSALSRCINVIRIIKCTRKLLATLPMVRGTALLINTSNAFVAYFPEPTTDQVARRTLSHTLAEAVRTGSLLKSTKHLQVVSQSQDTQMLQTRGPGQCRAKMVVALIPK